MVVTVTRLLTSIKLGPIVVTSFAVSFALFNSPPPDTVAVLVADAGALAATFTVTVMEA